MDIRNRDMSKMLSFKNLWLSEQYKKLRLDSRLDHLTNNDLKVYLLNKYDERRLVKGRLYNNATMENKILDQEKFIDLYLNRPYILSGYACLFENQDNSVNISSAALENLGDMRKYNKKLMEAAEHGSDAYIYYRILQLTYKVLMNSYYRNPWRKKFCFLQSICPKQYNFNRPRPHHHINCWYGSIYDK